MQMQVIIADTEAGATTTLHSHGFEWSKDYKSWQDALDEALHLNLLSSDLHCEAKLLPPSFAYHGTAQTKSRQLSVAGFMHHHAIAA